ncbi:MAG: bacterioferritin [Elusimicrobia bacterium]|nr:bacterioferritin [Elusimicrobiota bacterium]
MPKNRPGDKTVLGLLNKAHADELTAIHQYMAQHYALADADYGPLAAQVKLVAIDEMLHSEKLAERIHELGGVPLMKISIPTKHGQKVGEMMHYDSGLEVAAIEDYNRAAKVCLERRDSISSKLFELLAQEEQAHLNYFDNVAGHIKELGQAYLAQVAGGPAEAGGKPAVGFVASQAGGAKAA